MIKKEKNKKKNLNLKRIDGVKQEKKINQPQKTNKTQNKITKLIVANWKMNPNSIKEAVKILETFKKNIPKKNHNKIVICPPFVYLWPLIQKFKRNQFTFGSQNISAFDNTESNGEISQTMLKNLGVEYVIIGHSERRAIGESNHLISQKINNAVKNGFKAILCIGEQVRDVNGEYLHFIQKQLIESLENFDKKFVGNLVIAYEPIWTIGQGHDAINSHELHQINLFIKKVLVGIFDRKIGLNIPILYGGSVDDENAKNLIESGEVAGLLVGRASLNPYVFSKLLKNLIS